MPPTMPSSVNPITLDVRSIPAVVATAAQSEHDGLEVLWDNLMKGVNRYTRHKKVVVLLMYWKNTPKVTDMDTEQEVTLTLPVTHIDG